MDLHQRKTGRITLPGTDINVRSCIPAFYPPGKQTCSIPNNQLQVQDALIPIQQSSCSTQVFSFDQGPPPPQMITHEAINQHQDIEYITLPVYKTRKNDPQQHYSQADPFDGRFHQESNATLDLRAIQNLSYSPMPEPHPYFCLARPRNPIHQEVQKFMAFQPPPRSPCREPQAARALVSQHNSHYEFEGKEDPLYYPKNFMINIPGRRPAADIQLPIPFQWVEVNKQKINQNPVMKSIPEKPEGNARENQHQDAYLSPLNFSTTSHSSLESLSHYSTQRSRELKNAKCSCSEDSDRISRKSKHSMYSIGNQTDFLKSPLEEKFLFRETILFGCDEIGKWARKLPMVSEISEMGDYIREKTTQSRAQNICSALGLEIEDQVIVSGYLKVFLKVADSWLEARNCFGLTDNCTRKACQLNSPEISQNYLEWQHASRRLLGNIIHGVGSILAPKGPETENSTVNGEAKVDCRLTRSTSNLQKFSRFPISSKRPLLQRQKWTISDTASTTSQCSSNVQMNTPNPPPRYYNNQVPNPDHFHYSPDHHPIMISDLPQHKITPLSQIEPPCLRKPENSSPSVDISSWFNKNIKDGAMNANRFQVAPSQIKPMKPNIQKSQSVTAVYPANDGSQDSSDDVQQKIYMKPGSYNVPKKKLSNAKKRNNMQKAKESCCGDTDIPRGFVIPFVNAGPFVPPPNRGLQNSNIKIVKNVHDNTDFGFKTDENVKIMSKTDENSDTKNKDPKGNLKQFKTPSKTMKTDEWLLSTLINSQALRPQILKNEESKSPQNKLQNRLLLSKGNSQQACAKSEVDCQDKDEKGQDESQDSQIQSQASSDKSSHGVGENMTNRSQSSATSRSMSKSSKGNNKSVWHNSKRRRVVSPRTFSHIEDVVNELWGYNMPDYMKQAVKSTQMPDYYKIIKYPVFLETIMNKVKNGIYETTEQFIHDCRRLIFNSSLYFERHVPLKQSRRHFYFFYCHDKTVEMISFSPIFLLIRYYFKECGAKNKPESEKIQKFGKHLEKLIQNTFENWDCWNHISGDPQEVHFFPELRYSNGYAIGKKRPKTPKNGSKKED